MNTPETRAVLVARTGCQRLASVFHVTLNLKSQLNDSKRPDARPKTPITAEAPSHLFPEQTSMRFLEVLPFRLVMESGCRFPSSGVWG